jgi:membrane protease YdiL (CAAX protease family)
VETSPPDIAPPPEPARPEPKSVAGFFLSVMVLFAFVGIPAQHFQPAIGLLWSEAFVFLLPAAGAAAGSNLRPWRFLRLSPAPRPLHLALGLGLGGALFLVAGGLMAMTTLLLPRSVVDLFDLSKIFQGPPWERAAVAAVAALAAPLAEEAAFRGYVQSSLGTWLRPRAAVVAGALLFAAMHLDPVRFPAVLLLGLAFGWLTWRTGSLWPAVAAHAANNGLGAGYALGGAGDPTEQGSVAGAIAVLAAGLVLALPVALAIQRATPAPPPPAEAIVRRDPADASIRFRFSKVPQGYVAAGILGMALLFLLGLLGRPGPPAP